MKKKTQIPQNKKRLDFIKKQRRENPQFKDTGIHSTAIIGEAGMGYEFDGDKWIEFPQLGNVQIGSDVRIGAYSIVKRGTIDDTIIGDGCKIGSHCNIGHNVIMGKHCLLTHRVSIAGSVKIGDNVFFGQGCIIKNKVSIGSGSYIGQGAVVTKDVPENSLAYGVPAQIVSK